MATLTHAGMGTVRTRLCLPTRSTMHHRPSRCCMWLIVSAATSDRRKAQPSSTAMMARSRRPFVVVMSGTLRSTCACSSDTQLPTRTPMDFALFTRWMPAASTGASKPLSIAVPQHAGLRGCTVQAGQRRGGIRDHERKRREAVLSVGGGWCHGQVFLYDARGAVMTCIPLLGPESKGILYHARLGPPAIAARAPSSILFRIPLLFRSWGVIHVRPAKGAEQRTNNDDDFYD